MRFDFRPNPMKRDMDRGAAPIALSASPGGVAAVEYEAVR